MAAHRVGNWSFAGAGVALVAWVAPFAGAQVAVFVPGTPQSYIDQVNANLVNRRIAVTRDSDERFQLRTRWADGGVNGDPITIFYSYVPDGVELPGMISKQQEPAGPSRMFLDFDTKFDGFRSFWIGLLDEVFEGVRYDSWGSISGITFTKVTGPAVDPDGPEGPLPEQPVDWDDGSAWGTNGPILGGGSEVGDIRIAAKVIDGIGGVFGYAFPPDDPMYPGEIVLDVDELWEDDRFGYRRLVNIMSHLVGIAIGMDLSCPANDSKVMEPIQDEKDLLGPAEDDIRGVQVLYGDVFENNDIFDPITLPFFPFDPIEALLGQEFVGTTLSIDQQTDVDLFVLTIPAELGESVDIDVRIEAKPVGTLYQIGPDNNNGCGGVNLVSEDARIAQNLRVSLRDVNQMAVAEFRDINGDLIPADGLGYIDEAPAGEAEIIIGNITTPGVYYIEISSSGAQDPLDPQIYDLSVLVGNQIFSNGAPMDVAVADNPPYGVGTNAITNLPPLGNVPEGQETFTGIRAVLAQIDGQFPSLNHNSLRTPDANTPNIRMYPQQRVAYPGGLTTKAAVGGASLHATVAAAAAVGNPEGVFGSGAVGAAFETSLVAGSIATRVIGENFNLTKESLTYALFTVSDPVFAAASGLQGPATVISNPFGFAGDTRGDTYVTQLYDAVAFMYGMPIVAGTGNDGDVDQTAQCGGSGQNVPGGPFRGGRTVAAPATGYNILAVGAIAKQLPEDTPALPEFVNARNDPYDIIADFSGKGPIDSYDYLNNTLIPNARPGVDVVAPGTGYVLVAEDPQDLEPPAPPCSYMGHRSVIGLTSPAFNPLDPDLDNPVNPERYAAQAGTSISAGIVAGTIAVLQDAALAADPPFTTRGVVMRALVVAGADKVLGWSNTQNPARPQDNRDGAESLITDDNTNEATLNPALFDTYNQTRSLDYAQGAGRVNAENSYAIFLGRHVDPEKAFFVPVEPGTETQDPVFTDPTEPTITDPPRELQDINPSPFGIAAAPQRGPAARTPMSVQDLPVDPIAVQRALRMGQGGVNDTWMQEHADFGDAKLDEVNGDKGAGGTSFTPRPPFKLPPNPGGGFGGNPFAPPPLELEDKMVVGPLGWDHAMIGQRIMSLPAKQPNFPTAGPIRTGYIDYFIAFPFDGETNFQAALCWDRTVKVEVPNFSDPDDPQIGEIISLEQENLDMQLIQCDAFGTILEDHIEFGEIGVDDGGQIWDGSRQVWSNTEFMSSVPDPGFYVLRVRWIASNYDLFRNEVDGSVEYGLAWMADRFGGLREPEGTRAIASSSSSMAGLGAGQRVMRMATAAMGSRIGDAHYNAAFDADQNGLISARDVMRVMRFWSGR